MLVILPLISLKKIEVMRGEIIILPPTKSTNLSAFIYLFVYFSSYCIHLIHKYLLNGYHIPGNVINLKDSEQTKFFLFGDYILG